MVQTRSQGHSAETESKSSGHQEQRTSQKRSHTEAEGKERNSQDIKPKQSKTKAHNDVSGTKKGDATEKDHEPTEGKTDDKHAPSSTRKQKLGRLLQEHGGLPLEDTGLEQPGKATADTMLALLLNATLSSARISHKIASNTTTLVIKAGYHKLDVLKKSTWEERTKILTEGGYTHYREKTASMLGELAETIEEKFDGDLNNILKQTSEDPGKIRTQLKTIKGIGDVGVDVFMDTAQHLWTCLAPFIDPRSMKTAKNIGLGDDVQSLWEGIGKNPETMAKLSGALTNVRLEGREQEFAR